MPRETTTDAAPYEGEGPGAGARSGRDRAGDGAREPAPGEADPTADDHQRDRRTAVWGTIRPDEDGWSDTS